MDAYADERVRNVLLAKMQKRIFRKIETPKAHTIIDLYKFVHASTKTLNTTERASKMLSIYSRYQQISRRKKTVIFRFLFLSSRVCNMCCCCFYDLKFASRFLFWSNISYLANIAKGKKSNSNEKKP